MDHPIKRDHSRFRNIIKGKIRKNLRKYVSEGEIAAPKKGGGSFGIPMPWIESPRFKFGEKEQGGVGQGDGDEGDPIKGNPQEGGEAGQGEGNKEREVEFELSLEEMASILGEELELPNIEPKGKKNMQSEKRRYSSISTVGPDALRHYKRSYKNALHRQMASGSYNLEDPAIIPIKGDIRYRSSSTFVEFENSAVIIYMMDVSGSMGEEQKEIVRTESFWINLWLKHQYKDIEIRYIIHDATAKEVNEEVFFSTRESGGTLISSALKLCNDIIVSDYDPDTWNIYPFHFSDGDNWSTDDTKVCLSILKNDIIPVSNMFCYGQVESRYGSGQFYRDLSSEYGEDNEKVILSKIKNKEAILDSIKDFLGKGR